MLEGLAQQAGVDLACDAGAHLAMDQLLAALGLPSSGAAEPLLRALLALPPAQEGHGSGEPSTSGRPSTARFLAECCTHLEPLCRTSTPNLLAPELDAAIEATSLVRSSVE